MTNLIVIGLQWGDEGKGKIVDYLSEYCDVVARFQGGSNAGHTVSFGGKEFKFRLLPSGAIREKWLVIGNGVVIDPYVLLNEIDEIEKLGLRMNLIISDKAHLITPYDIQLDKLQEGSGPGTLGTTKSGIGPAYAEKALRVGLRLDDFTNDYANPEEAWKKYEIYMRSIIKNVYGADSVDISFSDYDWIVSKISRYAKDCSKYLNDVMQNKKSKVIFEGAQGTLLDIDHGSYPYVTSSNCVAAQAAIGCGISHKNIGDVLGVVKAYSTRIGAGPFPTEILDPIADNIRIKGHEYGTVTGRPRRCGWLDLVALKYATQLNGVRYLALTKLDVLAGFDKIKVCTEYDIDGYKTDVFPTNASELTHAKPIYKEFDDWDNNDISTALTIKNGFRNMPPKIRDYIKFIENFTNTEVTILSLGADRTKTAVLSAFINRLSAGCVR